MTGFATHIPWACGVTAFPFGGPGNFDIQIGPDPWMVTAAVAVGAILIMGMLTLAWAKVSSSGRPAL